MTGKRALVLVADDEASIRETIRMVLDFEGYRVEEAGDGLEVLQLVRDRQPDTLILDIRMPRLDGLEALKSLRERGYTLPVIMISGHADVQTAVEATRRGAFDFLEKPLERERLLLVVRNAVEAHQLYRASRESDGEPTEDFELVGRSEAMSEIRRLIALAAPTPATVLIRGESGTGKEIVARGLHRLSSRRSQPFVRVNCAAIPEELIESELFGHEKGSFTGAVRKQTGKFVAADGGTIFLDEVGDMSARTQAKVLRVLESGEVEPVGAERESRVDVRVVAATNRDLESEVRSGRFREDLFFRLNVVPIRTPPLREHLEDIPDLVEYFVRRLTEKEGYRRRKFSAEVFEVFGRYGWPGNVRELRNTVERLLILSRDSEVGREEANLVLGGVARSGSPEFEVFAAKTLREFRDRSEREFLRRKLEENQWNVRQTAQAIETPRSNLYRKLEQYGLIRPEMMDEV